MPFDRWNIPHLGIGVGLRSPHFNHVLQTWPKVDFFEIVPENFLETEGRPRWVLAQVAERYPVVMHGVSLSIGSTDPFNMTYLTRLKNLADSIRAPIVSDHLCWTGVRGRNTHDLLPVPYTEEALRHCIERVRFVQDFMQRPLILENPSTYMEFAASSMTEWEFLTRLCEATDCGVLLDINNIYVSSHNHGFDPLAYLNGVPPQYIAYHHVAGHMKKEKYLLDTHNDHVLPQVWEWFGMCEARTGGRSLLLEWDEDIPAFEVVHQEALKAQPYAAPREPVTP
ncbi:MAG: MNIO family bufferin maturase [Candidatus Xenobia bacterium]